MKSSILPLSGVPRPLVEAYLISTGLTSDEIAWKYYDERFNRGRERGYAWLHKSGEVRAFIGMIPVSVGSHSGAGEMVWTCDWSVRNYAATPGVGVRLLQAVHTASPRVGGVGGSDFTHAIVPRMSTHITDRAAVFLHLPLRLGFLLEKLGTRVPALARFGRGRLGGIPVRRRPRGPDIPELRTASGVAPPMAPLFAELQGGGPSPLYGLDHLEWSIGRAPGIDSRSLWIEGADGRAAAGALLWARRDDRSRWRAAFRVSPGNARFLRPLVLALVRELVSGKAASLSVIVSHRDAELLASLRANGFIEGPVRWPVYLYNREGVEPVADDLAHLSFLDTDLATFYG